MSDQGSTPSLSPSPPPTPSRGDRRNIGAVVFGLLVLGVGIYFLLRETFNVSLPDIGEFWPIFVIILGAAILYSGFRRADT